MTTAYEIAKQGGPHKGLLRRYANDPDHLIEKAIKTYEKRIAEHRAWIANPMLKVGPDITEKEIHYLTMRKWPDNVHRLVQERDVMMGIERSGDVLNRLDVVVILEEVLLAARQHGVEAAKGSKEFDQGLAMAYYDVLTVAIEQAQLLGVDLDEIGLAGFDPDKEILNTRREAISAA